MIRIAVVEDDDEFVEELSGYLDRFEKENHTQFSVTRFRDGQEITGRYGNGYDLILMDIQMERMDGMRAAELIRGRDSLVVIIFITNRSDYAIRGYQVDALDYVLKPVNYLSFSQKMHRAVERIEHRAEHRISINTKNGLLRIDASRIFYVESQGHLAIWHTELGDFEVRERMQDIEKKLVPYDFFRSNKGYLVNLRHVDGISDGCCLINGSRLLISRSRKSEFMAALTKYMGENG